MERRRRLGYGGRHRGAAHRSAGTALRCSDAARCIVPSERSGPTSWSRTSTSCRCICRSEPICRSVRSCPTCSARPRSRRPRGRWRRRCWLAEQPLTVGYRRAHFHAISESTRDDLVARGVAGERIRVIHPGVDSVRFTPGPPGTRSSTPRFLYVGRLKRYKGIGLAVRALAVARRRRPDIRLDIAGTGDHRVELEQLAAELGLADAVTFHGFVSEADKVSLLRAAWANVFPSPKEGWGITVVEAAACGTPVARLRQSGAQGFGPPR